MGATVTCDKAVSAMKAADGHVYYALHESTYEKNVTPYRPSWECFYFGRLEGAIERIFYAAASCEGGMLQTRKGWTTPEAYLSAWMKAFATPRVLYLVHAELRSGDSYMASVPSDHLTEVVEALTTAGLTTAASELEAGQTIRVNLASFAGLLAEFVAKKYVSVYRTFNFTPCLHAAADDAFAYTPALAKRVIIDTPAIYKLTGEELVMCDTSGAWRSAGWAYEIVANYTKSIWRSELSAPGGYRRQIKAYREAVKSAPPAPAGVSARITTRPDDPPYVASLKRDFAAKHAVIPLPDGFATPLTPDNADELCRFDRKSVQWFLPTANTLPPRDLFSGR